MLLRQRSAGTLSKGFRLSAAITALLANLIFMSIVFNSGSRNFTAGIYLSIAFFLSALLFSTTIASKTVKPLSFTFLLYWIYGLLLPGMFQARNESYFWSSRAVSPQQAETAAIIVLTGTLFLAIGLFFPFGGRRRNHRGKIAPRRSAQVALVLAASILFYCLVLLAWLGPAPYFRVRELADLAMRQAIGGGEGLVQPFVRTFPMAAAISVLAITLYVSKSGSNRLYAITALLLAICANCIVNYPLAIPRYFIVAGLFVVLVLGFPQSFARLRIIIYFIIPIFLYLVFPILGKWNRGANSGDAVGSMSVADYMSDGDLDGFQSIMNAVYLVDVKGLSLGNRILSSLLFFVPRTAWSGKSEATGLEAAKEAGYNFLNISMPLPGEFYSDLGYFGVAVGMFFFGVLLRSIESRFGDQSAHDPESKVLGAIFAGFMPIVVRGPLLSTVQALVVSALVVALWLRLSPRQQVPRESEFQDPVRR